MLNKNGERGECVPGRDKAEEANFGFSFFFARSPKSMRQVAF